MRYKRLWILITGLALATMSAGLRAAAQSGGMEGGRTAGRMRFSQGQMTMGTITSVGVNSLQIKKQDGTTETVTVNDNTRYREDQQELKLQDLKAGDRVMVRGESNGQTQITAMMVRRVTEQDLERFRNNRAAGRIVSIKGNEIKVQNPQRGEMTIEVTDSTQFMKEGQPISLKDLKVGDRLFAMGKMENGHFTAERVQTGSFQGRQGFRGRRQGGYGAPPQ